MFINTLCSLKGSTSAVETRAEEPKGLLASSVSLTLTIESLVKVMYQFTISLWTIILSHSLYTVVIFKVYLYIQRIFFSGIGSRVAICFITDDSVNSIPAVVAQLHIFTWILWWHSHLFTCRQNLKLLIHMYFQVLHFSEIKLLTIIIWKTNCLWAIQSTFCYHINTYLTVYRNFWKKL